MPTLHLTLQLFTTKGNEYYEFYTWNTFMESQPLSFNNGRLQVCEQQFAYLLQ